MRCFAHLLRKSSGKMRARYVKRFCKHRNIKRACVEVPIMVDKNGLNPCYVGDIPDQLAGLNMTHIAVHNMVIKAAVEKRKDYIYMAAYLDPHTRDQLTLDEIKSLCDDLIEAHKGWLPEYH